ncbi:hypothetical protein Peur_011314 [Populus x canadensis]
MRKPSNKNVPISFAVSGIDQTILLLKLSPPLAQCNILTGLATLANRQHPTAFDSLAMETEKKERRDYERPYQIKGKTIMQKSARPGSRELTFYSPPGTGKSTMISAMANFLDYNVHDFELTTVKDSNELKKVLIETTGKSTIVVEDIDFSLDLT